MQYIVYLLVRGARPLTQAETLEPAFPHLEEVGRDIVAALPPPRLIKTHLPRAMTPFSAAACYIHVARNPFDCAVSFYHHTRGFPQHYDFAGGTFADYFECFIRGEVDFGDYFEHLNSWYEQLGASNVLFLTYEGIKADTRGVVAAVAEFLGGPALETARDERKVENVLAAVSFESMRKDQSRWSSERPADMPEFVRKGSVGDWQNLFAPSQVRRLLAAFESRTAGTPAARLWPDIMAQARRRL
jgi:Sulfotransferase domain